MKYKLIQRANPQKKEEKKYYPQAVKIGNVELKEIAQRIGQHSSLSRGDILSVISSFVDIIPSYLTEGYSVKLGELGTLRLSLSSTQGTVNEKEFRANYIKNKVVFTPGVNVKSAIKDISYQRQ